MLRLFLTLPILLTACLKDETVSGYANPEAVFHLQELDGAAFSARATISFPEAGNIRGQAPCNSYTANQSAPYPWLQLGPIAATRATCSEQQLETLFFKALAEMTLIEVLGETVILRNDADREMVFRTR